MLRPGLYYLESTIDPTAPEKLIAAFHDRSISLLEQRAKNIGVRFKLLPDVYATVGLNRRQILDVVDGKVYRWAGEVPNINNQRQDLL